MLNQGKPVGVQWFLFNVQRPLVIRRPIGIAASPVFRAHPVVKYWNGNNEADESFFHPGPGFFDGLIVDEGWKVQPVNELYEDYVPPEAPDPTEMALFEMEYSEFPVWARGYNPWP